MKSVYTILVLALLSPLASALHAGPDEIKAPAGASTSKDDIPDRWALVPTFSYSVFNNRQSWQEEDIQLYYQIDKKWSVGVESDTLHRPPSGTDNYFSALASYAPDDAFEVHAKMSFAPDPSFAANQAGSIGVQYQVIPELKLLLDYQGFNFQAGPINQIKPGVTIGINDDVSLTLRYVHGWAYTTLQYNYYASALNVNVSKEGRLTMAFAYGTDPESEIGAMGASQTNLSPAYTGTLFYRQNLSKELSLFGGVEYCYRLNQSGGELYQEITPTIGLAWKF